jgi:large subunit ribosomal protein L1
MSKTTSDLEVKKVKETKTAVEEVAKKIAPRKAKTVKKAVKVPAEEIKEVKEVKVTKTKHGKKYLEARKKYDINKLYPLKEAIALVKSTSISKFDGKVEAHLLLFESSIPSEINFPHLEAASKKVTIFNDAVLAEIKDGKTNFDVLIATPVTMPKLLPFARVLGPRGLMPNPKNGTLTDNPEAALKKLSVAKTTLKCEKSAPVLHQMVGKVSQPENELIANVEELIRIIKAPKIKKLVLAATMGPGIKVEVK